ncbi:MAG: hypothetical protein ACKVT2_00175 [Saprospiraceae bacterium]
MVFATTEPPVVDHFQHAPNPSYTSMLQLGNLPTGTKQEAQVSNTIDRVVFSGEISGSQYAIDLTTPPSVVNLSSLLMAREGE